LSHELNSMEVDCSEGSTAQADSTAMECGASSSSAANSSGASAADSSLNSSGGASGVKSYESLLEEGLIELVIHRASEEEVTCSKVSVDTYKYLLAAYLIKGDYDQSRLLWLRLPADVRKHPELQSLWGIGKAMIRSEHSTIYSSTSPYKDFIITRYRERRLEEVASVYDTISVVDLGGRLGYSEVEVQGGVGHLGWKVSEGWVMPVRKKEDKKQEDLKLKLSELASYVSFLENI